MPLCGIWVDIRALTCVCIKMQFFLLEINVMMSEGMDAAGTSVSSTSCSSSSADTHLSAWEVSFPQTISAEELLVSVQLLQN